jgi:hypothetical protein
MLSKSINFRELRANKGIGLKYFLWDLPKNFINSISTGLTSGNTAVHVGGLLLGLTTAVGVITALGVVVLGVSASVITVAAIAVGVFQTIKQSKAREKKIAKIIGEEGGLKDLKKQMALVVKNLSLTKGELSQEQRKTLHQTLLSLSQIEGTSFTDKLRNLFEVEEGKPLNAEINKILERTENPETLNVGIERLNTEHNEVLNEVKQLLNELLQAIPDAKYSEMVDKVRHNQPLLQKDIEFRTKIQELTQKLAHFPGDNLYEQIGCLYGLSKAESKPTVFNQAQHQFEFPAAKNIPLLNAAIEDEATIQALANPPQSFYKRLKSFVSNGLNTFLGGLTGFGIVVGIAAFAGVTIGTGGAGLIVLIAACVAALLGGTLYTIASQNSEQRRKKFKQEDLALTEMIDSNTLDLKNLNTAIYQSQPELEPVLKTDTSPLRNLSPEYQAAKTMTPEKDKAEASEANQVAELARENLKLKQELDDLKRLRNEQSLFKTRKKFPSLTGDKTPDEPNLSGSLDETHSEESKILGPGKSNKG